MEQTAQKRDEESTTKGSRYDGRFHNGPSVRDRAVLIGEGRRRKCTLHPTPAHSSRHPVKLL